ncbi:unnamed protein product [Bemisia tabaci]|uniref:Acylphosphatase-like domain-containing protein n=1 Tax=Bemisia tabaci TaxID=7038 RepID=A0A9P0AMU2_BEMTA|nr:unnamed protein product [Bemisia tabaci]
MGAGEELSTLVSVEFEVFGHVQGRPPALHPGAADGLREPQPEVPPLPRLREYGCLHSASNGNKYYISTNCKEYNLEWTEGLQVRQGANGMREGNEPIKDYEKRVYFTKYARDRCLELGLAGWIKNSKRGTIVGKMQGEKSKVEEMVSWLSKTGSPGSQIERCDLMNFEYIARQEFRGFSIRF